jgi:glycosyltransferase involved in cell wall biosynthesis
MLISLCVICGNEAHHIEAMLNSFVGQIDELSLVRAIGAKEPDATEEMARSWCATNAVPLVFSDYQNGVTAQAWKHVDSFAKARNQAFAQATGDWLVWADCDDVLAEADDLKSKLAELSEEVLMVRCPYDVRGTGKKLQRERFIRRSAFQSGRVWHHDVHENLLLLPNDRHVEWTTPIWRHEPACIKQDNRKRNLAILGRSVGEAATQYFYIHQEHYCAGNKQTAEQFGRIALSFPNLDDSFRYEVQLNLARISASRRESMQFAMGAHGVFPWCREAIASIIMLAFEKNDGKRAAWWASRMLTLPEPAQKDRPWTHESKWYGWAGHDLAARAYRLAGMVADANALQLVYHKHTEPTIRITQKTLGNSTRSVSFRDAWLSTAARPEIVEHYFQIKADDAETLAMAKQFLHHVGEPTEMPRAVIRVNVEDGMVPPNNWDERVLTCGETVIDAENIERILGAKKQ